MTEAKTTASILTATLRYRHPWL